MTPSDAGTRHLSIHIDRPAGQVYAYASEPSHLPAWAAGLGASIEETDGQWIADSPMGRVVVDFAPRNDFGVLDHHVTLPSGETVYNPVRVIADGPGCEVVFTLRRRPGVSAEEFRRDEAAVSADLATLKRIAEQA
ncbi:MULTISPECIES: SRPBCC family protein [unclassified Streptomyces]|uniref:SRPBCC family protein n=1 Tax=unclassified Streptomyces TaxID=2593676 RepID=UPI002E33E58A|nr:SRPBCC family protein [Streptomyces sp. NBC_01460]WSS28501.1 SRPBCC family protein [Streptomyces sp. NBC_01185]